MTDDTEPPFEPGETFHDPDTGQVWQVAGVERSYNMTIRDPDAEDPEDRAEQLSGPEGWLTDQIDRGDLQPGLPPSRGGTGDGETDDGDGGDDVETEPADADGDETFTCDECGREFESKQGLGSHRGKAHKDGDE